MSTENQQLTVIPPNQAVTTREPSVIEMLSAVIQKGVSAENVAAIESLVKLQEHQEQRSAKKAYIGARVRMQAEMKKVQATKAVLAKDGSTKYKVAPFEEIDAAARPIYQQHGFCVSFTERTREAGLVTKVCVLQHVDGHSEEFPYTVRIGAGPHGATDTQADAAAHSAAMRGALCGALNIVISHQEDDDEKALGQPITPEQAKSLKARVAATGTVEASFLKFAQAKAFEEIYSTRYQELDEFLAKRERIQRRDRLSPEMVKDITKRVLATGVDPGDFLKGFGVIRFDELPVSKLTDIQKKIASLEGQA